MREHRVKSESYNPVGDAKFASPTTNIMWGGKEGLLFKTKNPRIARVFCKAKS